MHNRFSPGRRQAQSSNDEHDGIFDGLVRIHSPAPPRTARPAPEVVDGDSTHAPCAGNQAQALVDPAASEPQLPQQGGRSVAVLTFRRPTSVREACALLTADPFASKVISGGTAVVLMMRQRLIAPEHLVSVGDIAALRGITGTGDDVLRIGAAVTLRELSAAPELRRSAPSLAYACGQVGNPRVRNMATIGGNLAEADYASDPPSVLISLGATCHVAGPSGERDVPVAELITGFYETCLAADELITHVDVPCPPGSRQAVYLKYRSRSSEDRACVGVAARVDMVGDRVGDIDVVVAAVASTPQRLPAILRAEVGSRLDDALVDRLARAYSEGIDALDDARGSQWYRRKMIDVFVRRACAAVRTQLSSAEGSHHG